MVIVGDQLDALVAASDDELEEWLTQTIRDELGTVAFLLRAVAWAQRGALARARADVDRALAKLPAYELVELGAGLVLYVTRDYDRALALFAKVARTHKYIAAQTLRALATRAARLGWLVEQRAARDQLAGLGVRDLHAHARGLQRARASVDPGVTADAAALWSVFEHQVAQLGARLDAVLEQRPDAWSARMLRARLHLRLAQLDDAARLLEAAPDDPRLVLERWALALARGDARAVADAALLGSGVSPSARASLLEAEACLDLGELDRARERVAAASGTTGAALLSILIDARAGVLGRIHERVTELDARAPGLLSDAARELELAIWVDGGLLDDRSALLRCCEHARTMLTPDRESPPWYATSSVEGRVRLRGSTSAAGAHDHDAADLDQAARLLLRASDKRRGSAAAQASPAQRSLSADQVERFIADGYVHLRGAFPRALADAVVAGAHRRLRDQPTRWLQGDRAPELAARVASYDPDDPQSWPEGRVDLLGDRRFAIGEFSPSCDRAITQLLGRARLRNRAWTNSLIINYPSRSTGAGAVAVANASGQPELDWESWHLDAPSTRTRLTELRAGLLVFVLFGDVEPNGGNTWLTLDSPAKVARALAARPEGVDFCRPDTAPAITSTCARPFEITGEAGDIFLVHPLMLHSASVNRSARIRWMGNPMIYVEEPLDHAQAGASPVERAIARALSER